VIGKRSRAFSSEVNTGSLEENAIKQKFRVFSDPMGSENILVSRRICLTPGRPGKRGVDAVYNQCPAGNARAMFKL
jgi:hypothetical protein